MDFKGSIVKRSSVFSRGLLLCAVLGLYARPLIAAEPPVVEDMAAEYEARLKKMKQDRASPPVRTTAPTPTKIPPFVFRGDEGIPFPDPSEVVPLPTPTVAVGAYEPTATPRPTRTPWQRPGRCERNETIVSDRNPEGNPQKVWYDLLFLDEDLIPLDAGEVFGGSVSLHPYGPKSRKGADVAQRIHGVPCVPYRIRRTERGYRYDKGVNALKNYSGDQTGRGKFHPFVEQKLFGGSTQKHTKPRR